MDPKSEAFFPHVHPDLVHVLRTTLQSPVGFQVVYGLRTLEDERKAVNAGRSTTMHSRHLANAQGVACAVDLAHLAQGRIDWAPGHEQAIFTAIALQIKAAAHLISVPIEWGGDWRHFKDWGHFQLPWGAYP